MRETLEKSLIYSIFSVLLLSVLFSIQYSVFSIQCRDLHMYAEKCETYFTMSTAETRHLRHPP